MPLQFGVFVEYSAKSSKQRGASLGRSLSNFRHLIEVHHRGKQVRTSPILVTAFLYPVFFFYCYHNVRDRMYSFS